MVRALAASLALVFALLGSVDAFACPDGCSSAASQADADRCNDTGTCVFCTGTIPVVPSPPVLAPVQPVQPAPAPVTLAPLVPASAPLDRPPRLG